MTQSPEPAPRIRWWAASVAIATALFLVPLPAWVVDEFYSRDLYRWLQVVVTSVSNLVPFAVLDLLIGAGVVLVAFRLWRLAARAWSGGIGSALWEGLRRTLRAVAVVGIVFMLAWGCNYRRVPLGATLGDTAALQHDEGRLQTAVSEANALAARLRPATKSVPEKSFAEVAGLLREPINTALTRLNRGTLMRPGRPKFSVVLTPFFTWAGVDGMINPLALESIVHPDLLPFERPFLLAHEWAHLAGHADEAEASAVGWLACMYGPPELAYSASIYLLMEGSAALSGTARRHVLSRIDPGVRADLEAIRERLQRQKPQVQQAASGVYDKYLKANRVPDGLASYSRALTLILSAPLRDRLSEYGAKGS